MPPPAPGLLPATTRTIEILWPKGGRGHPRTPLHRQWLLRSESRGVRSQRAQVFWRRRARAFRPSSVTDYEHQTRTGRGWARNVSRSASRSFTVIPGHAPWAERTSWASHRESTSSSRRTCSKDSTPRSYAVAASASSAARAGLASPRASSSEISSGISRTIFMRPAYTAPARLPMADFFQGHGEIKTRRRGDRGD